MQSKMAQEFFSYLQKEPPCIVYKSTKGKTIRTSDDIIDAIILTIVERESSNHQKQRQAIAYGEQLKQPVKAFEVMKYTLVFEFCGWRWHDGTPGVQRYNAKGWL